MDTFFAPAERASDPTLRHEIDIVCNSQVLGGILHSISGLVAVINEHRQLVALNDSFMQLLGIDNPEKAFGLRPGEAVKCIYADDGPNGCGTSQYCSTCGAAIAIVTALKDDLPQERLCALTIATPSATVDKALLVKAHPITIDTEKFILLFLQDVTQQQQRASLERTFYHDINNLITILVWSSELLAENSPSNLAKSLCDTSNRIQKEIAIQRLLSQGENFNYDPVWMEYSSAQILDELQTFFLNHPAKIDKTLDIQNIFPEVILKTDISLTLRVLCNMTINALEATELENDVKIWTEYRNNLLSFRVWNAQLIEAETATRIFQRNYSTKKQEGRGIGTYSMRLFGEKYLGGMVNFLSTKETGTIFTFSLPA